MEIFSVKRISWSQVESWFRSLDRWGFGRLQAVEKGSNEVMDPASLSNDHSRKFSQ
jgi:hypothetical protein